MFQSISPRLIYSKDELDWILEKYNRTPVTVLEDIDIIEKWLETQHHLPLKPCKRQILSFLIRNKFSIERTKSKLDFNYTIRSLIPDVYENKLPSSLEIMNVRNVITIVPFPHLYKLNRIIYMGLDFPSPEDLNLSDALSYFTHTMEVTTLIDFCLSTDFIINFGHADLRTVSKVGIMDLKKHFIISEKVYSSRIASVHIINVPSYAKIIIETVSNFFSKKIRERVHIHKDVQELGDFFPKKYLPKDLGFDSTMSLKEIKENWTNVLLEHLPHFEKLTKFKVDESKRAEKLENDDLLGYHGNFRKLEMD